MRTSTLLRPARSGRGALVALLTGAGLVLTPIAAQASAENAPPAAAAPAPGSVVAPTAAAQVAIDTALAQLGKPYVWAGAGPDSFDCSGLTQFAYAAAGIALPHSSQMQSEIGTPVARADLQPGDLVFFYSPVGHVGIYLGDGLMVHAPTSGSVVQIVDIDLMGDFNSARRLA
jgi:cell wall-associated NlpC family hydrolase